MSQAEKILKQRQELFIDLLNANKEYQTNINSSVTNTLNFNKRILFSGLYSKQEDIDKLKRKNTKIFIDKLTDINKNYGKIQKDVSSYLVMGGIVIGGIALTVSKMKQLYDEGMSWQDLDFRKIKPLGEYGSLPTQITGISEGVRKYSGTDEKTIIKNKIIDEAQRQGVDPALALAQAQQESRFSPRAKSSKGAMGVFQLMPDTARGLGVTDPYDIDQNIRAGISYLKQQIKTFGSYELALAAYNAGPGNVRKYKGIPPFKETENYVKTIMSNYHKFRGEIVINESVQNNQPIESFSIPFGQGNKQYPAVIPNQISKVRDLGNGVSYANTSNITSHTKLTSGYNKYYDPNKGSKGMGKFMGVDITSGIGHRNVKGGSSFHKGIDLAYAYGTSVYAFCAGRVTFVGVKGGFGRAIIIDDINGYRHVYGHLSQIAVSQGQTIQRGQFIGKSGSSGVKNKVFNEYAYDAHLHYGIWKPGGSGDRDYIDPRTYTYPGDESVLNKKQPEQSVNVDVAKNNFSKAVPQNKDKVTQVKNKINKEKDSNIIINNKERKLSSGSKIFPVLSFNQTYKKTRAEEDKDRINSIM